MESFFKGANGDESKDERKTSGGSENGGGSDGSGGAGYYDDQLAYAFGWAQGDVSDADAAAIAAAIPVEGEAFDDAESGLSPEELKIRADREERERMAMKPSAGSAKKGGFGWMGGGKGGGGKGGGGKGGGGGKNVWTPDLKASRFSKASERYDTKTVPMAEGKPGERRTLMGRADGRGAGGSSAARRDASYAGEEEAPDEDDEDAEPSKIGDAFAAVFGWRPKRWFDVIFGEVLALRSHAAEICCRRKGPDHFDVVDGLRALALIWSFPVKVHEIIVHFDASYRHSDWDQVIKKKSERANERTISEFRSPISDAAGPTPNVNDRRRGA